MVDLTLPMLISYMTWKWLCIPLSAIFPTVEYAPPFLHETFLASLTEFSTPFGQHFICIGQPNTSLVTAVSFYHPMCAHILFLLDYELPGDINVAFVSI